MRVRVHFNLHRKDFSVVDPKTGQVIRNTNSITLADVEFRVSEKGRQRVLERRCRSVHAYAVGNITREISNTDGLLACTYNPYRCGHFHPVGQPDKAVRRAGLAVFRGAYCYVVAKTENP